MPLSGNAPPLTALGSRARRLALPVPADLDAAIRQAIHARRIVELDARGLHRVAEVHVYGLCNGIPELLLFQLAGETRSGALPHWRRVKIADISAFTLTSRVFSGPRAGEHNKWDLVIAQVLESVAERP